MERLLILPQMDLLDRNLIISDLKKEDSFPQIVTDDGGKFSPRLHGSYADKPFPSMRRGPPPIHPRPPRHPRMPAFHPGGPRFSQNIRDLMQQDGWKTQTGRMKKKFRARPGMHRLTRHFRELTQQDGWKTRDGRMTKKCRVRLRMHSLAPHFIEIA